MRTVCIVQARLGSSRLPGKVLADLGGRPVLAHVIERAQAIPGVDYVVVAVPRTEPTLWQWVHEHTSAYPVPGHPTDVLRRYFEAAVCRHADVIVRVTGDCPLLDPVGSGKVLAVYRELKADFADNVDPKADGMDTEVFSFELLRKAHEGATDPEDREHVTPWMRRHARLRVHVTPPMLPGKWSVDTSLDLERVRAALA